MNTHSSVSLASLFCLFFFFFQFSGVSAETSQTISERDGKKNYEKVSFTEDNVSTLSVAWSFDEIEESFGETIQATPAFTGQNLVVSTNLRTIAGLDPLTGKQNWVVTGSLPLARRGFTIFDDGVSSQIYYPTGSGVEAIDSNDGKSISSFSAGKTLVPPIVADNRVIIATLKDGVKCYDRLSGELIWHTKLLLTNDGTQNVSSRQPRVWAGLSYSKKNDLIFVVTSNPGGIVRQTNTFKDLSVSLIAIKASSGLIEWSYQHIENDLWDFDLVGDPVVLDHSINSDTPIKSDVVIALTKTGHVITLNQDDGSPYFKDAMHRFDGLPSDLKGVFTPKKRSVPTTPKPFINIEVDLEKGLRMERESNAVFLRSKLRHAKSGFFLPPSTNYDLVVKGLHGGAEWPGATVYASRDDKQLDLIVPYNDYPWILRIDMQDKYYSELAKGLSKVDLIIKKIKSYLPFASYDSELASKSVTRWGTSDDKNTPWHKATSDYLYGAYSYISGSPNAVASCKSCHGNALQGSFQSEKFGDGFVPALRGLSLSRKWRLFDDPKNLEAVHSSKANQKLFDRRTLAEAMLWIKETDKQMLNADRLTPVGFWQILLAEDGLPATKAPWGGVVSYNLVNGSQNWKAPIGTVVDKLTKETFKGAINFGGAISTDTGLIFATGQTDKKIRALSAITGEVLWEHELPFSGSAPPVIYRANGCDYLTVVASGGKYFGYDTTRTRGSILSFKLSSCNQSD